MVLCTTRPYLSVENIDEDTRHWAKRNGIQNDGILWGPHKYRDLVRTYGKDRIVGVLEDEPEMVEQAEGLGLAVVVAKRPYNEGLRPWRYSLTVTEAVFDHWLEKWEMEKR